MTVDEIQAMCKSLKGVTEDIKWGHDLVFSIGGKMFCVVGVDQVPVSASFKVRKEEFDEMSMRDGFKPAPYMAKHKWVWVADIKLMNSKEWRFYTKQSYELVVEKLSPKIKKQEGLI